MKLDSSFPVRRNAKILVGTNRRLASFFIVLCLSFLFFMTLPVDSLGDIDWSLSLDVSKRPSNLELSPLDKGSAYEIWAEVISGSYRVSVSFVKELYERRYDFGEIALMLEMANASGKDPSEVAILRRRGLGWGAIAKKFGIHPAALKRAKGKDSLFRRYVLANSLAGYYGIGDSEVLVLLNSKGYDFTEIALAVNLCAHSGAPLREVIEARGKTKKWKRVAEKFKVPLAKLRVPPAELVKAKAKAKAKERGSGKPAKGSGRKKSSKTGS